MKNYVNCDIIKLCLMTFVVINGNLFPSFKQKKRRTHIMCKKNLLMEMKDRRGYAEMRLLLRRTNVNFNCMGEPLLEIVVMSYLKDPTLNEEELMRIAKDNAPMQFTNAVSVYSLMSEALQNVYTHKSRKLDKEGAVLFYISSIANEIRINAMLATKEAEEGIDATAEDRDLMTTVCKRHMLKPNDTFKEVLNHVAGRSGYDDIDVMVRKLKKYLKIDDDISTKTATTKLCKFADEVLEEKDKLIF